MGSGVTVRVNRGAIYKNLSSSGGAILSKKIKNLVDREVRSRQDEIVGDFDRHQVTKEIKAGPTAPNISGLTGGYGNLFSFIGFDSGDNPTGVIRGILEERVNSKIGKINQNGSFRVVLYLPSLSEIFKATPLPWADGASWVQGIEKGISNLGGYVYDTGKGLTGSRSKSGLQTKSNSSNSFKTTPYISKIILDFKNKIKKL